MKFPTAIFPAAIQYAAIFSCIVHLLACYPKIENVIGLGMV